MLGEAIDIVLHDRLYGRYFRAAFVRAYPDGAAEARTFLKRLLPHRHKVQHGGTCSTRDLEQCICYSNDVIAATKAFFAEEGLARQFNVPTFVRFVDNHGNDHHFGPPREGGARSVDLSTRPSGTLSVGDLLSIEVEIDESFSAYTVSWFSFAGDRGKGVPIRLEIERKHVGERHEIVIDLTSAEDWHRLGKHDDRIMITYRVLPPK
jgi:hypothetical protein